MARDTKRADKKSLSFLWVVAALAAGVAAAITIGMSASEGAAEIAGVMASSLTLCVRVFWEYRVKKWFAPLTCIWTMVNLAALFLWIIPMQPEKSKLLLQLVWPEFLVFAGLMWVATLLWGDLPPEPLD